MAPVTPTNYCPNNTPSDVHEPEQNAGEDIIIHGWISKANELAIGSITRKICTHCGVIYCDSYDTAVTTP